MQCVGQPAARQSAAAVQAPPQQCLRQRQCTTVAARAPALRTWQLGRRLVVHAAAEDGAAEVGLEQSTSMPQPPARQWDAWG